ncbi:MAG: DNA polymerase III subunit gamma and tau [Sporichthyaceae bacterium]|nr:DNA polymerase III subunit gamma and tau [Sporichthyaceae bacterium]
MVTQALYRRYRPVTFAEVIGQEHVTTPLRNALVGKRTHHAYLFSGPRGCGKTTSARILARCVNCEQGPTPEPCGVCQSCTDLGPGGSGSLDVIEIDAATHGLVDDARDLRERAFYVPASARYKVYIIDEAHMLGPGASNALLKVVEEPPSHVMFVFATTEPEKVIATIRSRVHHYPFRLVPPGELTEYLASVCEREGVPAERAVLSLVVRAGRGSVRDSLSVLDQLLAGAGPDGLTYAAAAALLGFTPASLLDDTVDAFAAGDAAAVFRIVDQVVEAGHDPKRFADDLLERLRDLIIIDAVPDAADSILGAHPSDELERMRQQAAHFGATELSRSADIVNAGLTEMRGATAPRLHLELICARVLLPGADHDQRGLAARLDRLERRLAIAGAPAEVAPIQSAPGSAPGSVPPRRSAAVQDVSAETSSPPKPAAEPPTDADLSADRAPGSQPPQPVGTDPGSGVDLVTVRRMWPSLLDEVKGMRRHTWTLLSHNAQVAALESGRLTLALVNAGARDSFVASGGDQIVHEALIKVLGVDWKVEAIVDPSTSPAPARSAPQIPAHRPGTAVPPSPRAAAPTAADQMSPLSEPSVGSTSVDHVSLDEAPSVDDADADETGLSHQDLLQRELGAKVIGEYDAS